jgi:hypothetical protein
MLRRINKTSRPVGHGLIALLAAAWFTGMCQLCLAAPMGTQALPAQGEHCSPLAPAAHPDCERHCDCAALESLGLNSTMDAIVLSATFPAPAAVPAWRAGVSNVRLSANHASQAERACLHPLARSCIQLK